MRQSDILESDSRKITGCPRLTFAEIGWRPETETSELPSGKIKCVSLQSSAADRPELKREEREMLA